MMRPRFLYFLYSLWLCAGAFAQTYNFSNYGEDKGLRQGYIYCISQSPEGNLVLSAGEAVCQFDGSQFTSTSGKSMKENIVTTHYIDARHITWLGHQQHGLSYIDYRRVKPFKDTLLNEVKISQITGDMHQKVWLAGSNGIYSIDTSMKLSKLGLQQESNFNCLAFDRNQNLLAGSPEGLSEIVLDKHRELKEQRWVESLKDKTVKQIIPADATGLSFWVLADDVIYGIRSRNRSYELMTEIASLTDGGGNGVSCIYRDAYDNLWVSAFGEGLRKLVFNGDPLRGRYTVMRINKRNGLASQNIQSIFQDQEGNMWFGTFGDGLIKKPMEMFSFYGSNEGIRQNDVKKVIDDRSDMWMATNEGLAVFNKTDRSYLLYNAANGFINDRVTTLFKDGRKLWAGTLENGLYVIDLDTRQIRRFPGTSRKGFPAVNCIARSGGNIMAGTPDGIFVFDPLSSWQEHLTMDNGLLHNNITHLFEDSKKRLWVSSHGAPPYYIFQQKVTAFKDLEGLNTYNMVAACEDNSGNIWIATDGDGVFRYDNRRFYNYTTNDGLLSNYCSGIETDRNNSVWVTHRSGLSELKANLKKFTGFTASKGLMFNDNNLNAVHKDEDGNLWFGTSNGVVSYNNESGRRASNPPEIFITDIQFNQMHHMLTDEIVKDYGYYSVFIEYKSVSLSDPAAVYYKYRLLDVDTVWKTTTMSSVDFPKLGDGDYTFEVMACNASKGMCSNGVARIPFSIKKPVWKNAWFYLLSICLLGLGIHQFILYRTRSLKRTQALLQQKVEEKTYLLKREKEAVELIKTDLEHKNKDIMDSIHYAKNIQDSLLPPDELMKDLFRSNCFVLFKPKDIVSGDFYWCSGKKLINGQELHLAAVVDCTGHGVPGAFLSILANDFLKQSLAETEVAMPNEILNYLNSSISSHLNQHATKSKIRDGMDIALVGIDYRNRKMYYSGANNPIYVFRKTPEGVEEIVIKATKQAIGSVNDMIMEYDLQTLDLAEGDTIYLFSDGYADQFGGERNKKITYKTFRSILAEAFLMPICQQKHFIEEQFEAWKRDVEQTDDVCVMGIRL